MLSLVEAPAFGGGTETYAYDGDGRRVQKIGPDGGITAYVYNAFGELTAQYSTTAPTSPPCTTCYYTYDHLGSVRLVTRSKCKRHRAA